jgi:uncharacterized protein YeeX (DUF496 family)
MSQRLFKGRTNNHLTWVMVDATDFATPESAVSAATKIKIYGKLRGQAAHNFVTSGAGSLTNDIQHIGASALGLYTIALVKADLSDASAAWYDQYIVSLSATGCAYQTLVAEGVIDESAISGLISDAHSAATQANSRVLLVQSRLSDLDSRLVSDLSDVLSAANVGNSRILLVQSRLSDFDSRLVSDVSDIRSMLSDMMSDFQSRVPKRVATDSQLSNVHSDLRSQISGLTVSVDTSDIASAVWADAIGARVDSRLLLAQSLASDAHSAAAQGNSRILLVQSRLSDFDSRATSEFSDLYSLLSDLNSNFGSRVPKLVASQSLLSDVHSDLASKIGGITAVVSASDISDIASAVRAAVASDLSDILSAAVQTNSRVLVVQSMASDIRSHVSDLQSDFQSRVPKLVATNSQLSDVMSAAVSDLRSFIVAGVPLDASTMSDLRSSVLSLSGMLSDAHSAAVQATSAAQQANSRALVIQSIASDVRSHVSDLQSDFQSRVPKRVATDSQLSDVHSDLRSAIGAITVNLTASDISDIASAVAAAVTTITASDISDIASRVDAVLASRLSDILSAAQQANSRALVVQSQASDIYSLLSDVDSNLQSRIPKRVATDSQLSALVSDVLSALAAGVPVSASDMSDIRSAITAGTITASDISDIASAVAVGLASNLSDILSAAQQGNSRLLVNQSRVSDIYSLVSDLQSDFQSRVPKRVATDSQLSDVESNLRSLLGAGFTLDASSLSDIRSVVLSLSGAISDAHSAAAQANSRILAAQSGVSDIYSLLSDLHSDVGVMSGVVSDITSVVVALPTSAEVADKVLLRNLAGGSDGGRTVQDALRFNRNKFTIAGGVLTVYEEDDTTIAWTAAITQTAGDPVTGSDPA